MLLNLGRVLYLPNEFHQYQMRTVAAITLLAGLAYYLAPPDKAQAFGAAMSLGIGFLVGKFSNGFKGGKTP